MPSVLPYPPIDKTKSEIRVLELHPGSFNDLIICKLETVQLTSSSSNYEALSYTWGDATLCRTISVNDCTVLISENASVALSHLRKEDTIRRIWIDAICINQQDIDERSHQVQLMKQVYQKATRVLVWLGPAIGESDLGLDLLEGLARKTLAVEGTYRSVPTQSLQDLPIRSLRELIGILQRQYFRRTWVIQETAVATSDPLVGCGSRWLSWSTWKDGLVQIYAYCVVGDRTFAAEIIDSEHQAIQEDLWSCRRFLDLESIRVATVPQRARSIFIKEKSNFRHILHFTRDKESSEARDRIYGVLGLIRGPDRLNPLEVITPDYSKSMKQIYRELTSFAINSEKSLDILFFRNHLRPPGFPSWLPNFALSSSSYPSLNSPNKDIWSACKPALEEPPAVAPNRSPMLSDDLSSLFVGGKLIDGIDRILDLDGIRSDPFEVLLRIRQFALPAVQENGGRINLFYQEEALWRTLLGGSHLEYITPCPSTLRFRFMKLLYQEIVRIPNDENEAAQLNDSLDTLSSAISLSATMPHRRLFITKTGRFGLGPPDCQQEDIVSLLWSFLMPVILRPCRADNQAYHEFMGDAYVHGMMHGEEASFLPGENWVNLEIR